MDTPHVPANLAGSARRREVLRLAAATGLAGLLPRFVMAADDTDGAAAAPARPASVKKGVGLPERRGFGAKQLAALRVGWYYNWGADTAVRSTQATFVPMIFSGRRVDSAVTGPRLFGFNEPDHEKQSHMTVEEALRLWPGVAAKAGLVGAPATAGNPVSGDWLPQFMVADPKVDFMTLHWYKGTSVKKFSADVQALHEKYRRPVWVTEFAPQTASSSRENPGKFKQSEVEAFIAGAVAWMEAAPFVEGYAWHHSGAGTSALFDDRGDLTATGRAYAGATARR